MSLDNTEQIGLLRLKKKKIGKRISEIGLEMTAMAVERKRLNGEMSAIDKEIRRLAADRPEVSDHAVLRYLQRVKGIDIEQIRNEIVPDKTLKLIQEFQTGKFPIGDKTQVIVEEGRVVTVIKHEDAA